MDYTNDIEHFNHVNKSALNIIPHLFGKREIKEDQPQVKKMMSLVQEQIHELKDVASVYENPSFATHLKLRQLKNKLNQLSQMLN